MAGGILLVIGNGFDLQCGLKSSYKDFFKWLRQNDARENDNLWAVHLLNHLPEGELWIDVESKLQRVLCEKIQHATLLRRWAKYAIDYDNDIKHRKIITFSDKEHEYIIKHIQVKGRKSLPFTSYWFLDELKAFECQFSEYLQTEVSGNSNYLSNVAKLMDMITCGEKVDVVNFNYTNPFKFNYSNPADNKLSDIVGTVTNVHGTYEDGNIIFGVDATVDLPTDTHIFTKTHRKMLQGNPDRALLWHVEAIKFYGHSLGKADYSYFQSIFDNYNLYGDSLTIDKGRVNPVVLQFYFTIYDESKKTEIIRDATDKVYKLITTYGDTLDNKDKGKNLLHKLLLEGRVQIEFFPNIKSQD